MQCYSQSYILCYYNNNSQIINYNQCKKLTRSLQDALKSILHLLIEPQKLLKGKGVKALIAHKNEITVVAHRVVHGGEKFVKAVLIDDSVISEIHKLEQLAPLHNKPNLTGIKEAQVRNNYNFLYFLVYYNLSLFSIPFYSIIFVLLFWRLSEF